MSDGVQQHEAWGDWDEDQPVVSRQATVAPMQSQVPAAPPMPRQLPPPVLSLPPFPGTGATPAPLENGHTLGLALLLTGLGAFVGTVYGGLYGGIAGGLYGGAAINALRAVRLVTHGSPDDDREAKISGTYAVVGAGVATWIATKAGSKDKDKDKDDE